MRRYLIVIGVLILFAGCGKKGKKEEPAPVILDPAKSSLIAPAQNSLCNSGNIISETQASIVLSWSAAVNTDNYTVDIKNLLTGALTTRTTTDNQLVITLSRNTPYAWTVTSKSNSTNNIAVSETWRFFVAGVGLVTYSPFPAAIIAPTLGQSFASGTGTVNLSWSGSDVDNDIADYDVYFGTTVIPPLKKGNLQDKFLNDITLAPKTTYYWKIITRDLHNNTSDSGIFQFSVN